MDPLAVAGSATVSVTTELSATESEVEVFTTRPDTIFGATYLVLAPEHPLVERITTADQFGVVEAYRARAARQDLVSRKTTKEKTGAFTGAYAVNPATGAPIPIWVADYEIGRAHV